jgi:L-rhamnose mutarotase
MFKIEMIVCLMLAGSLIGCAGSYTGGAIYGPTNPDPKDQPAKAVKRFASVIELRVDQEQTYRELHADVWAEVLAAIGNAKIQNYNIFLAQIGGKKYLFSYLEYTGDDAAKDFGSIAEDATTRDKWWPITDACQKPLPGTPDGQQWMPIEQLMQIE